MISGLPWGLALSSGVNTYLPLFLLALFARFGHVVHLSPRFAWLDSDQAIFILGALALGEILAQKFPVLDNIWDFLHTLLRPIAGALATGATVNTNNALEITLAMVMGGTLAAAAHSTKSGLRLMSTSKSLWHGKLCHKPRRRRRRPHRHAPFRLRALGHVGHRHHLRRVICLPRTAHSEDSGV